MGNYVLVVDDNMSDRKVAKLIIEKEGFVTIMAEDGHSAIDKLDECDYSLFVIDIQMPRMSGLDLLKRLKRMESAKHIPVLIMSGKNSPDDVKKAVQLGASDYVIKPIDPAIFSNKISQILKDTKSEWKEYAIDIPEDAYGHVQEPCKIESINEVGATLHYPEGINITKGSTKILGGSLFEKFGIGSISARCYELTHDEHGLTTVKVSFIGLEDEQRKKIRLYCRQIATRYGETA